MTGMRKKRNQKSWAPWFAKMVLVTRPVEREPFTTSTIPRWVSEARYILPRYSPAQAIASVKGHAPWLNQEAIAYRAGMRRPMVNGFFIA